MIVSIWRKIYKQKHCVEESLHSVFLLATLFCFAYNSSKNGKCVDLLRFRKKWKSRFKRTRINIRGGDFVHSYLRAIGFSDVKNRADFQKIVGMVMEEPTERHMVDLGNKIRLAEFKKEFMKDVGIGIVGEYDERGFFYLGHYFPYCKGCYISTKEDVSINKRVDTDAYTGMCDDLRFGVSMIFYLKNVCDFIRDGKMLQAVAKGGRVYLSALSIEGKIILGITQNDIQLRHKREERAMRKKLIMEAKCGNQEAIDSLTIDDIDTYARVSRRIHSEDLYSIVDTSLIPYGSESDNYSIVATILEWKAIKNFLTGEDLYSMTLCCNEMVFNLCINQKDLQGIPMIGARFKGNIWMQGDVR